MYWFVQPMHTWIFGTPGDALGFVLYLGTGGFISYIAGRMKYAQEHENALRILFQQTITSIADAMISVDDMQRIRLMNPIAEKLTGWPEREARGRQISEVFRVVYEGTDNPADIPTAQILRTGMRVDLAEGTELIARSGERVPLDDSGAPIRNQDGKVVGAVLVFRDVSLKRRAERQLLDSERRAERSSRAFRTPAFSSIAMDTAFK